MDARILQQRLDAYYPAFERTHQLPAHIREAVHALRSCRTARLGGHVQACPDGHIERVWYNSCRHRFCPQCAQQGAQHPECCPVCGQRLIRTATLPPQRTPRGSRLVSSAGTSPVLFPALQTAPHDLAVQD